MKINWAEKELHVCEFDVENFSFQVPILRRGASIFFLTNRIIDSSY